jgi:hypothetical protein
MKKFAPIFILLVLFISACKTNSVSTPEKSNEDFGTAKYYQKYQHNIDRLYQMLQGTFVCYSKKTEKDAQLVPWKVNNGQDSVITYLVPIKDPAKDGYWLICYQFITSLPDEPIYCAVQKITPIDRDTFLSDFFNSPTEIRLSDIIKNLGKVSKSIDLDQLVPIDETITYYRKEITLFKGYSNIYKDHQNQNLSYRREDYEIHPDNTMFTTKYFEDIKGKKVTEKDSRTAVGLRTQKKISDMIDKSLLEE